MPISALANGRIVPRTTGSASRNARNITKPREIANTTIPGLKKWHMMRTTHSANKNGRIINK